MKLYHMLVNTSILLHFKKFVVANLRDPTYLDWLVNKPVEESKFDIKGSQIIIGNGLISRTFLTSPDFATFDLFSEESGTSLLRAMGPEATISVDGIEWIVGGLQSSSARGYFNRSDLNLTRFERSLELTNFSIRNITSDIKYTPKRGVSNVTWPPRGLDLVTEFQTNRFAVNLHYEIYDGLPLIAKWIEIINLGFDSFDIGVGVVEQLHLEWEWGQSGRQWLQVQTDAPHGARIDWSDEKSVAGAKQPYFVARYADDFQVRLKPSERFASFKVLLMATPTDSLERRGLAQRKLMRSLAPWTMENPIFFHMVNISDILVDNLIEQMKETGFEMLIFSFGSGFNLETEDPIFIEKVRRVVEKAGQHSIEVGGYDLIALTRKVRPDWLAVNNLTYPSACMASEWFDFLLNKTTTFINRTGISMLETDGPYGGYTCSNRSHKYHDGLSDSVYQQNKKQGEFYRIMRENGIYLNQPDLYYFQGGNKDGMGYSEDQFSLRRWEDLSISRQTVYDNTLNKIPSQGWMFMPLVEYHSGGQEATFEPLLKNIDSYSFGMGQYLGSGVAACYRGFRIYDSEETREMVKRWIGWYKKYRDILSSDLIHVRRPSMQGLDAWLHANPKLTIKGLLMVFNPTDQPIDEKLTVSLYYTGIVKAATVSEMEGKPRIFTLSRDYLIELPISLPPKSQTWFLITEDV